jgi:carboxylesterase type B
MQPDEATQRMAEMGLGEEEQMLYAEHIGAASAFDAVGQVMTDYIFRVPTSKLADARSSSAGARTFAYDFRWPSPVNLVGACHCLDVPFAFDNLDAERVTDGLHGPNPPQELADQMHRSWVQFVTEVDPRWPTYDLERRRTLVFDTPSKLESDPLRVERELFSRRREAARAQS